MAECCFRFVSVVIGILIVVVVDFCYFRVSAA